MKRFRTVICLVLFAALAICAGCKANVNRPRATHAPIVDHTQPPLPEDYDYTAAEVKTQEGNVKYLTSSAFSSTRTKGDVSAEFKAQYSEFALRLLEGCFNGSGTLVSPLSVLTALQMTANGAQGQTLDEMMRVLGGNIDRDTLNQQLFNYYESLRNEEKAKFHVANAVWMTDSPAFTVNNGFVNTIDNTFRAELAKVPFGNPATVDAINKWCSDNTDEMIPKILDHDDVDNDTVMVLANALCFDALWIDQYEEYQVKNETFHGAGGDTPVKMMRSTESYYIKGAHETGFIKPYYGGYAYVALLPEEGVSIADYLKTLTGEELMQLVGGADTGYDVRAGLPKYSLDWDGSLPDVLKKLGMVAAFDLGAADFSALGTLESGERLYIYDVIHKTHIEVDESGTRAAAVTAVMVGANGMPVEKKSATVILDRPFVYAIIDMANGLPIFIGAVTDIG